MSELESFEILSQEKVHQIDRYQSQVQLSASELKIKKLQRDLLKAEEVNRVQKDKLSNSQNKLRIENQKSELYQRQIKALKERITECSRELNKLKQNPTAIPPKEAKKSIQDQIDRLSKQLSYMKDEIDSLKSKNELLTSKNTELNIKIKKQLLQSNSVDLVNQNSALTIKIQSLKKQLSRSKSDHGKKCFNLEKTIKGLDKSMRESRYEELSGSKSMFRSSVANLTGISFRRLDEEDSQPSFVSQTEEEYIKTLSVISDRLQTGEKLTFLNRLSCFATQRIEQIIQTNLNEDNENELN